MKKLTKEQEEFIENISDLLRNKPEFWEIIKMPEEKRIIKELKKENKALKETCQILSDKKLMLSLDKAKKQIEKSKIVDEEILKYRSL